MFGRTPAGGQVTIYLAGANGPVSAGAVTAVQDSIYPGPGESSRAPQCVDVFVHSAVARVIALVGTVDVVAAEHDAAKAAFETNLLALQASLRIAPRVSRERLIGLVMSTLSNDDRNDMSLTSPAADVVCANNEVVVFDTSGLVWQKV